MAPGTMSDRIRSPQFDAWRVNLTPVRKRDKLPDPIVCRVRKARLDLVDPASALGVFIDKFGLAGQRFVYTKDFAAYRRIEVACGLD